MPDPYAEFQSPAATSNPYAEFSGPATPPAPDAKPTPGYFKEALSGAGRVIGDIASIPKNLLTPHDTAGATQAEEVKMGPVGRLLYNIPADVTQSLENAEASRQASQRQGEGVAGQTLSYLENSLAGPMVRKAEEAGPGRAKFAPQTLGAVTEGVGLIEGPKLAGKAASKGLSKVGELRRAMAPKDVTIAGEKVPVLKGEANPETRLGRTQAGLKRAGIGEGDFTEFAKKQQAKVKQVIRNLAQQTSGMVGPMKDEPAAAMRDAADTTFEKARPMYNALDESLVSIPDAMENVSKVTEQAINRAKKLGANVVEGAGEQVVIDGRKYTPESDPAAWKNFQEQGMVPKQSGQPISTYMKVRSELLKMQRGTTDAALRNAIGNEIASMNEHMESALKGTPLYENWTEANRLWSKGYALRDVAESIRKRTKGTPPEEQAAGLSKNPTQVRGPSLVQRLNDLKKNGVLDRAFTPEEASNLRQSADILDRASERPGKEFKVGYGPHSTIWRNLIGLPFIPLVKAMTTTKGMMALQSGDFGAFAKIVTAEAANQPVKNRKEALDALNPVSP